MTIYQPDGGSLPPRGSVTFGDGQAIIRLFAKADSSTIMHELGHVWLEETLDDADLRAIFPQAVKTLARDVREWLGLAEGERPSIDQHELFARGFEAYLREGRAPTDGLRGAFAQFRRWLTRLYRNIRRLNVELSDDARSVFDRMLATETEIQTETEAGRQAQTSADRVADDLRTQLLEAGRTETQANAEAQLAAAHYRTRAENLGLDAFALYQERGVAVRRGGTEQTTLNQPAAPFRHFDIGKASQDFALAGCGKTLFRGHLPPTPQSRGTASRTLQISNSLKEKETGGLEAAPPNGSGRSPSREAEFFRTLLGVDRVMRGERAWAPLSLGRTPPVLQALGFDSIDVAITKSIIDKAIGSKKQDGTSSGKHADKVSPAHVQELVAALADPVAVVRSEGDANRLVVFTDMLGADGKPVVMVVGGHGTIRLRDVNYVASIHTRNGAAGELVYMRDEESLAALPYSLGKVQGATAQQGPTANILTKADVINRSESVFWQPDGGSLPPRGSVTFGDSQAIIRLFAKADSSTIMHELGHVWLEETLDDADLRAIFPQAVKTLARDVREWLGLAERERPSESQHEQFARGFEAYLREGRAPTAGLRAVFAQFRRWLTRLYRHIRRLNVELSDDARSVFDRMLATETEIQTETEAGRQAQTSADRVADDLRTQLLEAGRTETQANAEAQLAAAHYRTRAENLGLDAFALYQERGVAVRRGDERTLKQDGGMVLRQPVDLDVDLAREMPVVPVPQIAMDNTPAERKTAKEARKGNAPVDLTHPDMPGTTIHLSATDWVHAVSSWKKSVKAIGEDEAALAHLDATRLLPDLFAASARVETHTDRKNHQDTLQIRRFFAAMRHSDGVYAVKMTVENHRSGSAVLIIDGVERLDKLHDMHLAKKMPAEGVLREIPDAGALSSPSLQIPSLESTGTGRTGDIIILRDLIRGIKDEGGKVYLQPDGGSRPSRGSVTFGDGQAIIHLFAKADSSTIMHELGHVWLEETLDDADLRANSPPRR